VQKNQAQINVGMPPILRSYLAGLLLSTAGSSTTFTVAAGVAVDSSNVDVISLAASLSKTTSTWSVGAAGGSLDAGSIAANTWYHVYIIKRPDTQVVDIAISLSATNPNNTSAFVPAAYTEYRRIGAMKTNGSSQWTSFLQLGDDFLWLVPVLNANGLTCSTTSANKSVEVPPGLSFPVQLISELVVTSSTTVALLIYAPDTGTQSTGTPAGNNQQFASGSVIAVAGSFTVRTNTSGQVGVVASANTGTYFFSTIGYTDRRGKDS
jgi:hypothetical protein